MFLNYFALSLYFVYRHAVRSDSMRCHTASRWSSVISSHRHTSGKVRPQPLHRSSPCAVLHTAMHGLLGRMDAMMGFYGAGKGVFKISPVVTYVVRTDIDFLDLIICHR